MVKYPKRYFRERKRAIIERRKAEKLETYEDRRASALARGTRMWFAVCPLCGKNATLRFWMDRKAPPVSEPFFLQARYTLGRGSGFFLNEDESLRLGDPELLDSPRNRRVVENLCRNVSKIYEDLKRLYPQYMKT